MLGDSLQAGAVGMNDINVDHLEVFPTAFGHGQIAAAVGGESDPFSVRRPGRAEVAAGARGERAGFAGSYIQNPEIGGAAGARGYEDDLLAVGREGGLIVEGWVIGQALQAAAVGMNSKKIRGTGALGGEDNPGAVP